MAGGDARPPRGALLVASHDRAFLDNVVERVWELRDRRLSTFKGAYSAYLLQREAADARARSVTGSTDAAIAREVELVQRYRSQRKHVKMHEHERRLEALRANRIEAPALDSPAEPAGGRSAGRRTGTLGGDRGLARGRAVRLPGQPRGDGGRARSPRVTRLEVRRGERIGLVGPNGAGKSTLLRTIAGQLPDARGLRAHRQERHARATCRSCATGRSGAPTSSTRSSRWRRSRRAQARSYLARFLFRGDDVLKPVSELSGGERSRLELALLGVGATNLLLLDEPTNHLDIAAREALETFLRESGVVAGHRLPRPSPARIDLRATVGGASRQRPAAGAGSAVRRRLPRVARGRDRGLECGAASCARRARCRGMRPGRSRTRQTADTATPAQARPTVGAAAAAAARNGRTALSKDAYRRERERIEADLARLGERKAELEAGLEDPAVQANFVELRRLGSELADVDSRTQPGRGRLAHAGGAGTAMNVDRPDRGRPRPDLPWSPPSSGSTGPIGCGKSTVAGMLARARAVRSSMPTHSPATSPARPSPR